MSSLYDDVCRDIAAVTRVLSISSLLVSSLTSSAESSVWAAVVMSSYVQIHLYELWRIYSKNQRSNSLSLYFRLIAMYNQTLEWVHCSQHYYVSLFQIPLALLGLVGRNRQLLAAVTDALVTMRICGALKIKI